MDKNQKYNFGANILENLTTGMYKDSKIIFREYIQNACDAIDKAVALGILENCDEGEIQISIKDKERKIIIEDNGTGIEVEKFRETLANIADSSKKLSVDRGFRGIGRLAGLAYCEKLIFTTSFKGETAKSIMICNAKLMRNMLNENANGNRHTALEILQAINSFRVENNEKINSHYFKVEIVNINAENEELLDRDKVHSYLEFVAPVAYDSNFYPCQEIYRFVNKKNYKLKEYNIYLIYNSSDAVQIFKPYKMEYDIQKNNKDKIHDLEFKEIISSNGNIIAWLWFGRSDFKGAIPKSVNMRAMRIRAANIQIGDENITKQFFNEDRFANYIIGEIHILSPELIPNSQRDYFNENPVRIEFEKEIKKIAVDLAKIAHKGSEINSSIQTLSKMENCRIEIERKREQSLFINKQDEIENEENLSSHKKKADIALKKINKLMDRAQTDDVDKIVSEIAKSRLEEYQKKTKKQDLKKIANNKNIKVKRNHNEIIRRTDKLSAYDKKTRKIIEKIFTVIKNELSADKNLTEKLIKAIEDELK